MAGDSKTEKATDKKRRDERKKGNIFLSQDVIVLISLAGAFFAIRLLFPYIYGRLRSGIELYIGQAAVVEEITNDTAINMLITLFMEFARIAMPIMILAMVLAIVATVFQTRFLFAFENIKPKFSRLNPLQGLLKILSLRSLVEIVKGLIKIVIIFVLIYQYIQSHMDDFARLLSFDVFSSSAAMLDLIMSLIIQIIIAFAAIAAFDYFYQWWEYERQMRMSKQEVKEEYKQLEGDPKVKGKIKETQRKMAMSRMMQSVPTADVVIKNPTHFAVALKYDMQKNSAPVVVAKGQDEVALRIIRKAEENNVYVIENKPLARKLYTETQINQEIPADYYGAIAEILVYVYRLRKKL